MAWTERYVRADAAGGGDGTTDAASGGTGAWTLAEAITNVAAGHRVNVKAGTYANTTTDRTLSTSGTTTAPIWWRGFKTTIGDMDTASHGTFASGTDVPALTFTTGRFRLEGSYQIVSNLDIQGAQTTNGQFFTQNGTRLHAHRVRVECTGTNANSRALIVTVGDALYSQCWFKSHSTPDVSLVSGESDFLGCVFEGGAHGLVLSGATRHVVAHCIFRGQGADAVRFNNANLRARLLNCTAYGPAGDGLDLATVPVYGWVVNSIFSACGAYGITNGSGTNTANLTRLNNLFHSNTSGNENGFGDLPSWDEQADSSSPFAAAGSGNFSLVASSNGKANGRPGAFEGLSSTGYLDIGAVQRREHSAAARFILGIGG